jgi:hypothetical protein
MRAASSQGTQITECFPCPDGWGRRLCGFFAIIRASNTMPTRNHKNRFAAICCLLAVASLYSPLAAAVSAATGMACCTGRQCSIALHHRASDPASSSEAQAHNCGHAGPTVSACTLSCRRDSERAMVAPGFFIVPQSNFLIGEAPGKVVSIAPYPIEFTFLPDLLSPPPRISLLLL